MTLRKISAKRKATTKLAHNSTFGKKKGPAKARPSLDDLKKKGLVKRASALGDGTPSPRTTALEAADAAFSRMVRLTAAYPDGYLPCFICGVRVHWKDAVLMHCEPRACMSTRYSLINCQAGCWTCNDKPCGDRDNFRIMLDTRFGPDTAEKNTILSKLTEKMGADYLTFLAEKFNAEIAKIRKSHPEKFHDR